jgi:hypothetical protein
VPGRRRRRKCQGVVAEEDAEHEAALELEEIEVRKRAVERATAQDLAIEDPGLRPQMIRQLHLHVIADRHHAQQPPACSRFPNSVTTS